METNNELYCTEWVYLHLWLVQIGPIIVNTMQEMVHEIVHTNAKSVTGPYTMRRRRLIYIWHVEDFNI